MTRFLRGTVRAEAFGGDGERLLSFAAVAGIPLWEVRRQEASLYFHCFADHYRRLRPFVRRCGVRMRITARRGLPFLLRPLRLRWGLAVGGVMAAVLLGLLSTRVWVVTVDGNVRISDEVILRVLEPTGIKEGMDFDTIDLPQVQLTALQRLPSLDWLTVNRRGGVAEVLVREREITAPVEETAPANIIAACDGVIVNVDVFDGQAAVKAGDGVTAGSLLISGVTDSAVGPLLRRAQGSVTARVTETVAITVPLEEVVTAEVRREQRPTAVLFGWRVPLYTATDGGAFTETTVPYLLTARGRRLPIGWTVTERIYYEERMVTRTAEQALAVAYERLANKEAATALTVENRTVTEQKTDTGVTVEVTIIGLREIGVNQVIER